MNDCATLVLITGVTGSGKTTLGKRLAQSLTMPYVDYDTLTEVFLQRIRKECDPELEYRSFLKKWRGETYQVFWDTIAENLAIGVSVIATAPCSNERKDSTFFSTFKEARSLQQTNILNIHLVPTRDRLRQLLEKRGLNRDTYHLERFDVVINGQEENPQWDVDSLSVIHYTDSETPLIRSLEFLRDQQYKES